MLLITIGLGFLFITLNINNTQVVPTFVGYVLIIIDCVQLEESSHYFKKAIGVSIAMFLINMLSYILALFFSQQLLWTEQIFGAVTWGYLALILSMILHLFVLFFLVKGLQEIEQQKQIHLHGAVLMNLWIAMAVIQACTLILLLLFMPQIIMFSSLLLIAIKVIQYVFWGFFIHAYTIYRQSA